MGLGMRVGSQGEEEGLEREDGRRRRVFWGGGAVQAQRNPDAGWLACADEGGSCEFQDSESRTLYSWEIGGSWGLLCFRVLTFVGSIFSPRCLKGLQPRLEPPLLHSFSSGERRTWVVEEAPAASAGGSLRPEVFYN